MAMTRKADWMVRLPNGKVVPLSPEEMDALNGKGEHKVRRQKVRFLPGVQKPPKAEERFMTTIRRLADGVCIESYHLVVEDVTLSNIKR